LGSSFEKDKKRERKRTPREKVRPVMLTLLPRNPRQNKRLKTPSICPSQTLSPKPSPLLGLPLLLSFPLFEHPARAVFLLRAHEKVMTLLIRTRLTYLPRVIPEDLLFVLRHPALDDYVLGVLYMGG